MLEKYEMGRGEFGTLKIRRSTGLEVVCNYIQLGILEIGFLMNFWLLFYVVSYDVNYVLMTGDLWKY